MPLRRESPLADKPRGRQKAQQRGLSPVTQQNITERGSGAPKQDTRGPVLVEVEDLSRQENGGAEGGCPQSMQRGRKRRETVRQKGAAAMQDANHQQEQRESGRWRKLVPVCSNKQRNSGGEEDAAENHRQKHRPAKRCAPFLASLERQNPSPGLSIDQTRLDPLLNPRFQLR